MADLARIVADLETELDELDDVVAPLGVGEWDLPTPADPWTIRDQISHLAFFDEQATLALSDPARFTASLEKIADALDFTERPLQRGRAMPVAEVLEWWRSVRAHMLRTFRGVDAGTRVPWYGYAMSAASFFSARLMETWAHGQDIVDTLGVRRKPTERLRHIAHLGVRARGHSYRARGLSPPSEAVCVELLSPSGELWTWNDDAEQLVAGDALDFCFVVTQRRHLADTDLRVEGPLAEEWMAIAQAFAGPPGSGRKPGQFPKESL